MQKEIFVCWIRDFDNILVSNGKNKSIIFIYRWTRQAAHWQPAQFQRVGRFPLNCTQIDGAAEMIP